MRHETVVVRGLSLTRHGGAGLVRHPVYFGIVRVLGIGRQTL